MVMADVTDKEYLAKSSGFKVTETYDREVQFLDEVAREKERIISLGPLGEGEGDGAVEARPEDWEMEFPTA